MPGESSPLRSHPSSLNPRLLDHRLSVPSCPAWASRRCPSHRDGVGRSARFAGRAKAFLRIEFGCPWIEAPGGSPAGAVRLRRGGGCFDHGPGHTPSVSALWADPPSPEGKEQRPATALCVDTAPWGAVQMPHMGNRGRRGAATVLSPAYRGRCPRRGQRGRPKTLATRYRATPGLALPLWPRPVRPSPSPPRCGGED